MPMAAANYHNTPKKSLILRDNEFMGDLAAWVPAFSACNWRVYQITSYIASTFLAFLSPAPAFWRRWTCEPLLRSILLTLLGIKSLSFDLTGIIYYVLNVPLFIIAYRSLGHMFFRNTLLCTTAYTVFLSIVPIPSTPIVEDIRTCEPRAPGRSGGWTAPGHSRDARPPPASPSAPAHGPSEGCGAGGPAAPGAGAVL